MDQVFGAQMKHMANKTKINSLKHRVKKLMARVHATSGFKTISIEFKKSTRIVDCITHELFDTFSWNKVRTGPQASWKEYFHSMYELLVHEEASDHASDVIIAYSIVKFHDVLKVPERIKCNDPMYPVISSLSSLFAQLKAEQITLYKSIENIKENIAEIQLKNTEIQHTIIALKMEQKELEEDNSKYMHIMKWSAK
jgi:hypothetical protein